MVSQLADVLKGIAAGTHAGHQVTTVGDRVDVEPKAQIAGTTLLELNLPVSERADHSVA
jgi:hypothetical protein